jgi:hypothetical protein
VYALEVHTAPAEGVGRVIKRGTAWFLRPDLIVTAFHVVGVKNRGWLHQSEPHNYRLKPDDQKLLPLCADHEADIALLECAAPPAGVVTLSLADRLAIRARWEAKGFPKAREGEEFVLSGKITAAAQDDLTDTALQLLVDQTSDADWEGMSGSAVRVHGLVGGVLTSNLPRTNTIYAASVAAVQRLLAVHDVAQEFERECLERQQPEARRQLRELFVCKAGIMPAASSIEPTGALQLDALRLEMALKALHESLHNLPRLIIDGDIASPIERVLSPIRELVKQYPFPKVRETNCYELLGVNMSEQVDDYPDHGERPPYIGREKDREIISALSGSRHFVLLAGPSAAGKTRTAYEMLLRHCPDAYMLVPAHRERLSALIEAYKNLPDKPSEAVLWLDDLDRFLQTGDPLQVIATARAQRLLIVATIHSKVLTKIRKGNEGPGREVNQLLDRADIVTVSDRMTGEERERAGRLYPDVNFEEGIGESLIAGKRLRERYDNGPSELVAVICAANDWRRAGLSRAIPAPDLNELFKSYFRRIEPRIDATRERFASGIEAACDPIVKYSVLLMKETPDSETPASPFPTM